MRDLESQRDRVSSAGRAGHLRNDIDGNNNQSLGRNPNLIGGWRSSVRGQGQLPELLAPHTREQRSREKRWEPGDGHADPSSLQEENEKRQLTAPRGLAVPPR